MTQVKFGYHHAGWSRPAYLVAALIAASVLQTTASAATPSPPEAPTACRAAGSQEITVRLLVVYDQTARERLGGGQSGSDQTVREKIAKMIQWTNDAFKKSGVHVRLAFTQDASGIRFWKDYKPGITGGTADKGPGIAALCDLTCGEHGGEFVHAWRLESAADLVVFFYSPSDPPPECGMAWVVGERGDGTGLTPFGNAPYGYAVVSLNGRVRPLPGVSPTDCPTPKIELAHEVGHLFGAGHEDGSKWKGAFSSSHPSSDSLSKTLVSALVLDSRRFEQKYSDGNAKTIEATRRCVAMYWERGTTTERQICDSLRQDPFHLMRLDRCRTFAGRCMDVH